MYSIMVDTDQRPVFPDVCVVCGQTSPGGVTGVKVACTRRVAWVFNVITGEWGADVPTCPPCGQYVQTQHRGRFILALLCVVIGVVVAVLLLHDERSWWRIPAMTAIVMTCMLPYFLLDLLNHRPVSLSVDGTQAIFSFRDPQYAAEFKRLNTSIPGNQETSSET